MWDDRFFFFSVSKLVFCGYEVPFLSKFWHSSSCTPPASSVLLCECLKRAALLISDHIARDTKDPTGVVVATAEIIVGMVTGIPWRCCQKAKVVSKCQKNWCRSVGLCTSQRMWADILLSGTFCCWGWASCSSAVIKILSFQLFQRSFSSQVDSTHYPVHISDTLILKLTPKGYTDFKSGLTRNKCQLFSGMKVIMWNVGGNILYCHLLVRSLS